MIKTVRIIHYKTFRGRHTGTQVTTVPAILIMSQRDGSVVVELLEAAFGYKRGHSIAIDPKNIL